MSWLRRALRRTPQLSVAQLQAVAEWRALPRKSLRRPLDAARLVVVDVESSGLDARRDRLISIGALAVNHGAIELAQSFEVILRQAAPSEVDNILVHCIGGAEQRSGADPAAALISFLNFAGTDPLVAFHADFDRVMLRRALEATVGADLRQPWLDLASLAPALLGKLAPGAQPRRLARRTGHRQLRAAQRGCRRAVDRAIAAGRAWRLRRAGREDAR